MIRRASQARWSTGTFSRLVSPLQVSGGAGPHQRLLCEPLARKAAAKGLAGQREVSFAVALMAIDDLPAGLGLAPEAPGSASGG